MRVSFRLQRMPCRKARPGMRPEDSTHLQQSHCLVSSTAHVPQVEQGGILKAQAVPAGHHSGHSRHGGQRWQRQLHCIVKVLR